MSTVFIDADASDKEAVTYLNNLAEKYYKKGRSDDAHILRFAALAIRLRAERDIWKARIEPWEELWRAIKEMEPSLGDANKPLAIAASYALLQSRIGNAVEVLDSIRALLNGERHPDDAKTIVAMINGFPAQMRK